MRLNRIISTFAIVWNIVAFFVFIAMLKPSAEFQPQGLRVLEMNSWPIGNKTSANSAVFGAHISSPRLIAWEVLWFVSSIGGAVVVFRCEIMIVGHFRRHGSFQHEKTRRMHQEFHRALLAMAVCPIITTAIPISYFIVTIGLSLCPGPISAFLSTATSSITAFNPLTTILFMRCYRQAFLRTFRCLRWEVRTAPVTGVTDFTGLERAGRAVGR